MVQSAPAAIMARPSSVESTETTGTDLPEAEKSFKVAKSKDSGFHGEKVQDEDWGTQG